MSQTEVQLIKADAVQTGDIANSAVTDAKISGVASSKLTGALPAISGAALTNLPASGKARNIFINGDMSIAQRGTSESSINGGYETVDRFKYPYSNNSANLTQAQVDVASGTTPYTLGFRKSYKVTNGTQSGIPTNARIRLEANLEAQDIAQSGWNYNSSSSFITLSFWVKSSVSMNFYGYIRTPDGTSQGYGFETGTLSADTWTKIVKTIPGSSNLTFDNDAELGWNMVISMYHGTSMTTSGYTLNQWAAYDSSSRIPDQVSTWYTTNGATWEITGLQLEVGDTATDFEHLSFADNLRKCQRYYFQGDGQETGASLNNYYGSAYGSNSMIKVSFPTTMRTKPTVTTPSAHSGGGSFSTVYENFTEIVYYITGDTTVSLAPSEVKVSAEL